MIVNILVIQHSAGDSAAAVNDVIDRPEHRVQTIRVDRGAAIPQAADADGLMLFGGAISLTSPDLPTWVAPEQELIRRYVDSGRKVFAICLGSQMLASALGANVRRNEQPEIGWHTIDRLEVNQPNITADVFPDRMTVLQWHEDTFGIPDGATRLFESKACRNQGFSIDNRVFGFQFHLEANARTIKIFLAASEKGKQDAPFVQSPPEITQGAGEYLSKQTAVLTEFLQRWLA